MDSFNEKIGRINVAKANIKQSLINKGQTPSDNIEEYAEIIDNISTGSGDSGIKLFETIEAMKEDTTAKEGDLAVVYNVNGYRPIKATDKSVQKIYVPKEIHLPFVQTHQFAFDFRTPDYSTIIHGTIDVGSGGFLAIDDEGASYSFEFSTTDNQNFVRTDTTNDYVELSKPVYPEPMMYGVGSGYSLEDISYFMYVAGGDFNGIYQYNNNTQEDWFKCSDGNYYNFVGLTEFLTHFGYSKYIAIMEECDENNVVTKSSIYNANSGNWFHRLSDNKFYGGTVSRYSGVYTTVYHYDGQIDYGGYSGTGSTYTTTQMQNNYVTLGNWALTAPLLSLDGDDRIYCMNLEDGDGTVYTITEDGTATEVTDFTPYNDYKENGRVMWYAGDTQLNTLSGDVFLGKQFYGQNGVENGALGAIEDYTTSIVFYKKLKQLNDLYNGVLQYAPSSGKISITYSDFAKDTTMITFPDYGLPFSGVYHAFYGCSNLRDVPVMDLTYATAGNEYDSLFYGCSSLTDASLSNICKSLATASINYSGTKTLKIMGITAEQVARLTETDLANMTAAGWTTGY